MLLRVTLAVEDIRKVTIEEMLDMVDGLHLILKTSRLQLKVQLQDSMFNNELCNLRCMSDLPKDSDFESVQSAS